VLGRGDREAGHRRGVEGARRQHAGDVVGAEEVDQMRGAAQARRLVARDAARAEVVQLERQLAIRIVRRTQQELAQGLLCVPARMACRPKNSVRSYSPPRDST
jgi:hypothetical protein